MYKIHCVFHKDRTPSLVIYGETFHCFGCGAHGRTERLGLSNYPFKGAFRAVKEDLNKSLVKIGALPKKLIRGFELPYDSSGYFIVYPNTAYYTKRLFEADNAKKYKGPTGHSAPLFIPKLVNSDVLFIIEGQLNALSAAQFLPYTVVSPGSATNLMKNSFVQFYLRYNRICIIVDRDAAGVSAGLGLKEILLKNNKNVVMQAVKEDYSSIYVENKEKLKEELSYCTKLLRIS